MDRDMPLERAWWRHQMETFSALLAICAGNSPVSGEFPAQRPVTRSFDVFYDLRRNKRLNKQSWCWWFETLSRPLWRNCNGSIPSLVMPLLSRSQTIISNNNDCVIHDSLSSMKKHFNYQHQHKVDKGSYFSAFSSQWFSTWLQNALSDPYHPNLVLKSVMFSTLCPQGLCIGYPSEIHLKLKSREISYVHHIRFNSPIALKFCTENAFVIPETCAKFQNDWWTEW